MRDTLLKHVKDFLALYWKEGAPIAVACSGGADSKALLYLLIECQRFFKLEMHVAHVDHGWRAQSRDEAESLKREIEGLGLPFHLHSLAEGLPQSEEAAREARYAFLARLGKELGAQAVVLGHQMEDQAETVLKRVLEGAPLPACGGMKVVSVQRGTALWRPLLGVSKKELIQWLEKRSIAYVQDETNLSEKYLRGRLRTSILPLLEASFGKAVVKNLCRLGDRAQKLGAYFKRQTDSLWSEIVQGEIHLNLLKELEDPVLEFFVKEWTRREGMRLSADETALLKRLIRAGKPAKGVQIGSHQVEVCQEKLAIKLHSSY